MATLSISYYDLGVTTGKMAVKILTGEADISRCPSSMHLSSPRSTIPIWQAPLGVTIPEGYEAIA